MFSLLAFIVSISVLILVHEFGHFIFARRLGVRVEKFSLGFGPRLFAVKRGETTYQVCAILFGGYVKMAGDSWEDFKGERYDYLKQKPSARAQIIAAGAALNYILGLIFFCAALMFGMPDSSTTIGEIVSGYPAEQAGILAKDKIVSVDGKEVDYWIEVVGLIHDKKGDPVKLSLLRDGKTLDLAVTTKLEKIATPKGEIEASFIGIKQGRIKYGFKDAVIVGTRDFLKATGFYYKTLGEMLSGRVSFRRSVAGPIGIYYLTSSAASAGLGMFLYVLAILNLSLAVINLMPFPVLDGGHLALIIIEKARGRRLSKKIEDSLERIGISLIGALAVFVLCNDLINFGIWENAVKWFGKFIH